MNRKKVTHTNKVKILIADDDPISLKLLQKTLSETVDVDVVLARNGKEAWASLHRDFAPLAIADWMMPEMDGLELCRKIRQTDFGRYVYTILLTARDDQSDIVEGLNAGADDYIRKPFDPHELQLRIKAGLRIVRLEEELAHKNGQLQFLNAKLEELARVDPVMKIGNRNSFYEAIDRLHSQSLRYGRSYGLLICDIDHFKLFNDTRGHQAGDCVLYDVAQAIRNNIRTGDEVFRYGGEELVVLLPEQTDVGAINSAQRICDAVRKLGLAHPKSDEKVVTISIGAATSNPSAHVLCDWKDILEKADQSLYRAKAEGRNRVCKHDPQTMLTETK